ncbi:ABC transporter ATP-binding protein [Alkalibacter mobilis]|uniref:ABC transporter ATP-binding protein n=1 Tax=Alkalibacter mobilis TaxID=2787712 RepID=UPI00189CB1E4|nr:ABC transporter ATP-binding protein [Alkalibacter mobilis]MBF7095509.1 ATP-binding cassette domain-containing protein [Alkalibacter mobilis]
MFILTDVLYKNILNIRQLNIKKGSITCIVGESGSGKSTLIKLLNNLINIDSGEILYDENSIDQIDPIELRRKVVMLPQTPAIFNGSIRDNMLIGLKFSQKPMVKDDVLKDLLKKLKLTASLDKDADLLSGGEKQRIALARILLMDPEVLLLDEPSSALDEITEEIIIQILLEFARDKNKTIIMVTHSKKVVNLISDKIIEIKRGKEIFEGGDVK